MIPWNTLGPDNQRLSSSHARLLNVTRLLFGLHLVFLSKALPTQLEGAATRPF